MECRDDQRTDRRAQTTLKARLLMPLRLRWPQRRQERGSTFGSSDALGMPPFSPRVERCKVQGAGGQQGREDTKTLDYLGQH